MDPKLVYLKNLYTAKLISPIEFYYFLSTFYYSMKKEMHIGGLYKYFNIFLCFLCLYILIVKLQIFLLFLFVC